jgi:hypothetical protein
MSAPFGQTIVPSSSSTRTPRNRSRFSRTGSNIGPQSSSSRSISRSVPSLNTRRRTNPSSGSTEWVRAGCDFHRNGAMVSRGSRAPALAQLVYAYVCAGPAPVPRSERRWTNRTPLQHTVGLTKVAVCVRPCSRCRRWHLSRLRLPPTFAGSGLLVAGRVVSLWSRRSSSPVRTGMHVSFRSTRRQTGLCGSRRSRLSRSATGASSRMTVRSGSPISTR